MKKTHGISLLLFLGAALAAYAADAQANWEEHCTSCHGSDGKGQTKMGKKLKIRDLTDVKVQAEFSDEQAFKAIKEGVVDQNGKTRMKAIEAISDEAMKALIPIIRDFKK